MNLIDELWIWTYSLIVGWGASFTIAAICIAVLFIKLFRLRRRVIHLENRIITQEREFSLYANKHKN